MAGISERYADKIDGVLGCFDRMIITGGRTFLRYKDGKCLHYYFYFIDEEREHGKAIPASR